MNIYSFLSQVPKIIEKKKKRLGRGPGSGKGAKSGKGTTRHQAARENIPLHFEGGQGKMTKKFPLLRGKGRNKGKERKPVVIYSDKLNIFDDGAIVTIDELVKKGLVDEKHRENGIKIILKGKLTKKITTALPVSQAVKEMIEKLEGAHEKL